MGDLETITVDGRAVRAHRAGPVRAGAPGVVLFHAWWGLNDDLRAYADRLGAAGFAVLAPDLYDGTVVDTVEDAERMATSLDEARSDAIALAATDTLVERLGPDARIAAAGFSLGVPWAMWTPAERPGLAASVAYYGTVSGGLLARGRVPVLAHFAEADEFEPDENVAAFEDALRAAGREVAVHRYPGTGHWFAEPSRDAFRPEASELAFARTVDFLRAQLGDPRA
ncbi:MAG: dienelactone hydrolase family protein [Chloroflexota bacterium]